MRAQGAARVAEPEGRTGPGVHRHGRRAATTTTSPRACAGLVVRLLFLGSLPRAARSDFLTSPAVAWTFDLQDVSSLSGATDAGQQQRQQEPQQRTRQLQQQNNAAGSSLDRITRGNAVTVTPDGSRLFVTESNGALHMVGTASGAPTTTTSSASTRSYWMYAPNATQAAAAAVQGGATTTAAACRGGVAIYDDDLVLYAVTESPLSTNGDDTDDSTRLATSQILAVHPRTGKLAWSVTVGGTVVGTPWISNRHVYVVRNTATNGYVTVLEISDDAQSAKVVATVPDPAASGGTSALGWLGPPTGHAAAVNGAERDVVVVALAASPDARNEGGGGGGGGGNNGPNNNNNQDTSNGQGGLYALVPSADYDALNGRTADAYDLRIISSYPLLTDLPPAFDGTSVYLAHQDRLSGWEGADQDLSTVFDGTNQDRSPTWEMRWSGGDSTTVSPTAPVFTPDSAMLLVSTISPGLSCRDLASSSTLWSDNYNDLNYAEPVVSVVPGATESMVYVIQNSLGVVSQYGLSDGTLKWEVDCAAVTGSNNCGLAAQADFSVSGNGNALYFAYSNGTVVALSVATFATDPPTGFPTTAPSQKPVQDAAPVASSIKVTPSPSFRGSSNGTSSEGGDGVDAAENESTQSSASPFSLPVILGAAAGGLLLVIAVITAITCRRKRRRVIKSDKERAARDLEAVRKWNEDKAVYDKACKEQEQETLQEISGDLMTSAQPATPVTLPTEGKKMRSSSASRSKSVPSPMDSITEDADFDDGSEAGIEVSIADVSVDPMGMSDDDSLKMNGAGKQQSSVAGLLEPIDPTLVSDFDDSTTTEKEDMIPIVRNLTNSFAEVATPGSHLQTESTKDDDAAHLSKPDPEGTGSSNAAHLELIQAVRASRKAKTSDSTVLSGASTEEAVKTPVLYRPEDGIVQASKSEDDGVEVRGRPTSPDFSDIWSVDGSLYLDEESKATRERSVAPSTLGQPDDEPGQIAKGLRAKSPAPQLRPTLIPAASSSTTASRPDTSKPPPNSTLHVPRIPPTGAAVPTSASAPLPLPVRQSAVAQLTNASRIPEATKISADEKIESIGMIPPRPIAQSRISPQVRGGSARPRAGLFTRREHPLVSSNGNSSDSGSDMAPAGYIPEREARASYTPLSVNHADDAIPASAVRSLSPKSVSSSKATERTSNQGASPKRMVEPGQLPQRQSSLGHSSRNSPSRKGKSSVSESRLKESAPTPRASQNQKSARPQSKGGAYAAWDSFLTELAKVEDTFFNPKLGGTQTTERKGRARSSRPPARRARSADAHLDSDSDSESSFSAGLNPVV